jgi:hypothetical protein
MHEFKAGELHSGSSTGPTVTNPKQAIAIALSEQKDMHRQGSPIRARPKKGTNGTY